MKRYLQFILIALAALLCSCEEKTAEGDAGALSEVSAEGTIGSVVLKWANPNSPSYYYTMVSYTNAYGEEVRQKVSVYDKDKERGEGYTKTIITGFEDTRTYEFTLTPYTTEGWKGETTTVSGTPEDAQMAYKYVAATAVAEPVVEGAFVSWTNEWAIPVTMNISFKDVTGKVQTVSVKSDKSEGVECLAFVDPTTITVTSTGSKNQTSNPVKVDVTPLKGEIPWSRMKIVDYSNSWGGDNQAWHPDNLIRNNADAGFCWHADPTVPRPDEHFVTIDLGAVHKINIVETVRRIVDYETSPESVSVYVGDEKGERKEVGTFAFDANYIYNHAWKFSEVTGRFVTLVLNTPNAYTVLYKVCIYYGDTATHYADEAAKELQPDPDDDDTIYDTIEYLSPYLDNEGWLNNVTVEQTNPDNPTEWTYTTTGGDSWLPLNALVNDAAGTVLVFHYKSTHTLRCEFFWCDVLLAPAGGRETAFNINKTDEWKTFKKNFANDWKAHNWDGKAGKTVRFDIGDGAGATVVIRNMHWRAAEAGE